jgi:hypothetical protein
MTLITTILKTSQRIPARTKQDVLTALVEEVGELATEIAIDSGKKKRKPGPDGIVGEAVDSIINSVDIIFLELKKRGFSPEMIETILIEVAVKKLAKWEEGVK